MNREQLKKKLKEEYLKANPKADPWEVRKAVSAELDKLDQKTTPLPPSVKLDYEKVIHETIWARTDKTIEDRIRHEKATEEIKKSNKQIKIIERQQAKIKKAREKEEAKYKARFRLLEPCYLIVNLMRETEEKLLKTPSSLTAEVIFRTKKIESYILN